MGTAEVIHQDYLIQQPNPSSGKTTHMFDHRPRASRERQGHQSGRRRAAFCPAAALTVQSDITLATKKTLSRCRVQTNAEGWNRMPRHQPLHRLRLRRFVAVLGLFFPQPEGCLLTFVRSFYFLCSEAQKLLSVFLFLLQPLRGNSAIAFQTGSERAKLRMLHPCRLPEMPALQRVPRVASVPPQLTQARDATIAALK